ncbi:MAG: choice-of-anchor Q domain-containing protein [Solirubrobacterales bacterium]
MRRGARLAAGVATGVALSMALVAGSAQAETFNVTTFADTPDATIDGNCSVSPEGLCSLRGAVQEAQSAFQPGQDRVELAAGTYRLDSELDVDAVLEIAGEGDDATKVKLKKSAPYPNRVIAIGVGEGHQGLVTIEDLTVTGGKGGTGRGGGGIAANSDLILDGVTVRGNRLKKAGVVFGGGVLAEGSLVISDSRIIDNRVVATDPGADAQGGGLLWGAFDPGDTMAMGSTVIQGNLVKGPTASFDGFAGGLRTFGPASISRSTFRGNRASRAGGVTLGSGAVTMESSTVSRNAAATGAGIQSYADSLTISNSTISGNAVPDGGAGAALFADFGSEVFVANTTIAANLTGAGATSIYSGLNGGGVTLSASVVDNPGRDCSDVNPPLSVGFNVDSGHSCGFDAGSDQSDADPRLRPLDDNGGPTRTHALRRGSDALGAVTAGCPPPATDQRGRPRSSPCDAGAFEKP